MSHSLKRSGLFMDVQDGALALALIKIGNGLDGDMYAHEYHHHLDHQDL